MIFHFHVSALFGKVEEESMSFSRLSGKETAKDKVYSSHCSTISMNLLSFWFHDSLRKDMEISIQFGIYLLFRCLSHWISEWKKPVDSTDSLFSGLMQGTIKRRKEFHFRTAKNRGKQRSVSEVANLPSSMG